MTISAVNAKIMRYHTRLLKDNILNLDLESICMNMVHFLNIYGRIKSILVKDQYKLLTIVL